MADLYPDEGASVRMMALAGINSGRIQWEDKPLTRWHFIVIEARNAGSLPELLQAAMDEYPQHSELRSLRTELGIAASIRKRLVVLAIWPTPPGMEPLDQQGEANALYDAGIDYVALRCESATRDGVVREWARTTPDIVQIGTHGAVGQLHLTDGVTLPGWWGRLVQEHQPQLIVLLACESGYQSVFNVADALIREGVPAVVSVDKSIQDTDAVRFVRMLYEKLTDNVPLAEAVDRAKLTLSDAGAEMVRLRVK